jgi:hypothetical protein
MLAYRPMGGAVFGATKGRPEMDLELQGRTAVVIGGSSGIDVATMAGHEFATTRSEPPTCAASHAATLVPPAPTSQHDHPGGHADRPQVPEGHRIEQLGECVETPSASACRSCRR